MRTYIYFHVCCLSNWKSIVQYILSEIRASGLYNFIDKIRVGLLGTPSEEDLLIFQDSKIEILFQDTNTKLQECPTLQRLHHDAKHENPFQVLYLHSKGITRPQNPNVLDWTRVMVQFNVRKFHQCISLLKDNDAVGINLQGSSHFSGNFWWSKSEQIQSLPVLEYKKYNDPEFWISTGNGKLHGMFHTNVNHYTTAQPESLYQHKDIQEFTRI